MQNISQAAMKNMTGKLGGGPNDPLASMMQQGLNMVHNNRNSTGGARAGPHPPGSQSSMNGPSGPDIDDIVNSINQKGWKSNAHKFEKAQCRCDALPRHRRAKYQIPDQASAEWRYQCRIQTSPSARCVHILQQTLRNLASYIATLPY